MTRYCNLIRIKPEWEERYIILHKYTFPGVLEQIRQSNIHNYSIFMRDGVLFAYFEYTGTDYEADMKRMAADPVTQDWWKLTDPTQIPFESAKDGEFWVSGEEVFHMGEMRKSSRNAARYGSVIGIKPENEAEYKKLHANVWPEVLTQIKRSNIQNYSIFLRDNVLYSYFEYAGDDFKADMDAMAADPMTQKWWDVCMPLQEPFENRADGEWWASMKEVFHTD